MRDIRDQRAVTIPTGESKVKINRACAEKIEQRHERLFESALEAEETKDRLKSVRGELQELRVLGLEVWSGQGITQIGKYLILVSDHSFSIYICDFLR